MQVFLPYPDDVKRSAESLDDLRLNKQITEINQILLTYINGSGGHINHPVNKWYKSFQGIEFLLEYQSSLCREYLYRFDKFHMGLFTYTGLEVNFLCGGFHLSPSDDSLDFKPAYIKGQVGKNQIITTENVGELYQKLLCEKWDNNLTSPK